MQSLDRNTIQGFIEITTKIKELFSGTLGTRKTHPADLELKQDTKPIFSRPYSVPKVHTKMLKIGLIFGSTGISQKVK